MGKRLLVVDDEPDICAYVKEVAEPLGFEVETTTHPHDFLRAYEREEPALICADVVMPDMDGLELLAQLGNRGCKTPVLLISGYNKLYLDGAGALGEAYGLPYVKCMSKPLGIADLRAALLEVG